MKRIVLLIVSAMVLIVFLLLDQRSATTPTGKEVAVADAERKSPIKSRHRLEPNLKSTITVIRFSPDSKFLAAGGLSGVVRCWNVEKLELVAQFQAHHRPVRDIAFACNATKLVTCGADEVAIWNFPSSQKLHKFRVGLPGNSVDRICVNNDATRIYAVDSLNHVTRWDSPFDSGQLMEFHGSANFRIVSKNRELITRDSNRTVQRIDVESSRKTELYSPLGIEYTVFQATPDGNLVAVVAQHPGRSRRIPKQILLLPRDDSGYHLRTSLDFIPEIALSGDRRLLAACGNDRRGQICKETTVELFDLRTKKRIPFRHVETAEHAFVEGAKGNCYAIAVSGGTPYKVAFGGSSGAITVVAVELLIDTENSIKHP
jgi:WD40 repeat protein